MKCQICKQVEAVWSWQPWGPDESKLSFALVGNHYRGFPLVKVCDSCKAGVENITVTGKFLRFTFKDTEYIFDGKNTPYSPYLWDGGTSDDQSGATFTMLCRYTPTGHDIVAHVYDALLAAELIAAYND